MVSIIKRFYRREGLVHNPIQEPREWWGMETALCLDRGGAARLLFVWTLTFNLSDKGGSTRRNESLANIAVRVTEVLKPLHHNKVAVLWREGSATLIIVV